MGIDISRLGSALSAWIVAYAGYLIAFAAIIFVPRLAHLLARRLFPWSLRNPLGRLLFVPWFCWILLTRAPWSRTISWWLEILGNLWSIYLAWLTYAISLLLVLGVASALFAFTGDWFLKPNAAPDKQATPKEASSGTDPAAATTRISSTEMAAQFLMRMMYPLVCLIALYFAAHLYLYSRFATFPEIEPANPDGLIASQQVAFQEILARIRLQGSNGEPLAIAIEGEWGVGKSWLMREISRFLTPRACLAISELTDAARSSTWEAAQTKIRRILHPDWNSAIRKTHFFSDREFIFITVNAWEFATEHDLHWGLFEALLKHTHVPTTWSLFPTNFLRYPLITIPVYMMRSFVQACDRGHFSLPGGMSVSFSLSGMLWQPQINRIIDELRADNRQVVWCLDEVDRSSPEMAQAALTLIRRFLNQPGSIVLVPYVGQQLNFKAFHPLTAARPDLESNMLAVLDQELRQRIEDEPEGLLLQERLGLLDRIRMPAEDSGPVARGSSPATKGTGAAAESSNPASQGSNLAAAATLPAGMDPIVEQYGINSVIPPQLGAVSADVLGRLTAAEPAGSLARRLRWLLFVTGLSGNSMSRRQREFLFQEKYLRQAHLRLDRLNGRDLRSIFDSQTSFRLIHDPIWELIEIFSAGRLEPEEYLREEVSNIIVGRMEKSVERAISLRSAGTGKRPVLRHFLDELRRKLVQLVRLSQEAKRKLRNENGGRLDPEAIFLLLLGSTGERAGRELQRFAAKQTQKPHLPSRLAGLIILVTLVAYIRAGSRLMREQP